MSHLALLVLLLSCVIWWHCLSTKDKWSRCRCWQEGTCAALWSNQILSCIHSCRKHGKSVLIPDTRSTSCCREASYHILESLSLGSLKYNSITPWHTPSHLGRQNIREARLDRRTHWYIMHLQKDCVLWCYQMQTTLKATEGCLFKSLLCQVPAVLQKADSTRLKGKCLWKQEVQVIHVPGNAGGTSSVFLFLFLKGALWIDLLSKKITPHVGKLLRKLSTGTLPSLLPFDMFTLFYRFTFVKLVKYSLC